MENSMENMHTDDKVKGVLNELGWRSFKSWINCGLGSYILSQKENCTTLNMNQDEVNYEVLKETQINILAFLLCLNFLSFFIWRLKTGFYIS